MRWYLPSWNGDFRLVPVEESPNYRELPTKVRENACVLKIVDPTPAEIEVIKQYLTLAKTKSWVDSDELPNEPSVDILIAAPMSTAASELVQLLKPSDRTITAVKYKNGQIEVAETAKPTVIDEIGKKAEKKKAEAATSVSRPTPCCPQCIPGSVERASEVLLTFLNEQEHKDWAETRSIVVRGGLTQHNYLIAHRHSATANKMGRICYDLDDGFVVHFYDWSIPPEEEVLAAKLILEHAEPWLRNEATCLGAGSYNVQKFKNPFGDITDGTVDSGFYRGLGLAFGVRE